MIFHSYNGFHRIAVRKNSTLKSQRRLHKTTDFRMFYPAVDNFWVPLSFRVCCHPYLVYLKHKFYKTAQLFWRPKPPSGTQPSARLLYDFYIKSLSHEWHTLLWWFGVKRNETKLMNFFSIPIAIYNCTNPEVGYISFTRSVSTIHSMYICYGSC